MVDQREAFRHRLIRQLIKLEDEHVDLKRYIRAFDMRLSRNTAFSKIPCGPVIAIDTDKLAFFSNRPSKYKTELCKYYLETGQCQFNGDCTFAHGSDELHQSNQKLVLCRLFHMTQNCPYGDQCAFIHDEYRRSSLIIQPGYLYSSRNLPPHGNSSRSRRSSSGYASIDDDA